MQLIDEFTPVTETTYLLVDAWYTSGKLMLHALNRGYRTSNRVIYPGGIKTNVKEFATHIRSNETCTVTAGDDNYYVYRYEGFRKQYMACIAKFAYSCAEKGVSLDKESKR